MEDKKIEFTGQTIFAGIDVHKNSWTVSIVLSGSLIKTFSMDPEPKMLAKKLKREFPGAAYKSVYEAGCFGFWIHRELEAHGIENIVVNPADIPSRQKERRNKTDSIDSKKLARELSVGHLEGNYIPTEEEEAFRSLDRLREQLVKDQTRYKHRIKSLLSYTGEKVPDRKAAKHWSRKFIKDLEEMKFKEKTFKTDLMILLETLLFIRSELLKTIRALRKEVNENEKARATVEYLRSVPGVGFITAVTLYGEIMNIGRFKRLDELCGYVGLVPSVHSSGETERITGISKQQNKHLRYMIIEAAWVAMKQDPALMSLYGEYCQRMIPKKAIIKIGKKLLSRIMHVWKKQERYTLGVLR